MTNLFLIKNTDKFRKKKKGTYEANLFLGFAERSIVQTIALIDSNTVEDLNRILDEEVCELLPTNHIFQCCYHALNVYNVNQMFKMMKLVR